MALVAQKQFNGRGIDLGLRAIQVVEPYKVTGLQGNINAWPAAVPQRGALHPLGGQGQLYEGAVVDRVRLMQWVNKNTALIAVIYRRELTPYSGGPTEAVHAYTIMPAKPSDFVPVWHLRGTVRPSTWYELNRQPWKRPKMIRTETRFLGGDQVSAVQRAIARSVGGWYQIDDLFYLLSGESAAIYDGRAYTRVGYRFEGWAPHPGVPANDPTMRNALAIPPLNGLQKWHTDVGASGAPFITVVPHGVFASQGLQLPGFP